MTPETQQLDLVISTRLDADLAGLILAFGVVFALEPEKCRLGLYGDELEGTARRMAARKGQAQPVSTDILTAGCSRREEREESHLAVAWCHICGRGVVSSSELWRLTCNHS
jgi:hypothetical protein